MNIYSDNRLGESFKYHNEIYLNNLRDIYKNRVKRVFKSVRFLSGNCCFGPLWSGAAGPGSVQSSGCNSYAGFSVTCAPHHPVINHNSLPLASTT